MFAERLKDIMIERGLTQIKLAELTGLRQGLISEWLSGKKSPSVESLIIVAEKLNLSTDFLLGLTDNQ